MSVDIAFTKYKEYNITDPDFAKTRGNMFSYPTYGSVPSTGVIFDYNFAGDGTLYPNTANGFPDGVVLNQGGQTVTGFQGVYIAPAIHTVMYITHIVFTYVVGAANLFLNRFQEAGPIDSGIQFVHSGFPFCERSDLYALGLIIDTPSTLIVNAVPGAGDNLYTQTFSLGAPGRFDGDSNQYLGIKSHGGTPIFLGASLAANQLKQLHFCFIGHVVRKVEIDGAYREIIPLE